MNEIVSKYLREQGYSNIETQYYTYIEEWEKWFENDVEFHTYHDQTGKERKMYNTGMAKRISEDWSSILFSERDEITTEAKTKKQTELNNKFLNEQIKILKIYKDLPTTIENAMALGTAGAILRVKNVVTDKQGNLIANDMTKLDIIYIKANQIVPLRVEHGEIIDVAFISEQNVGKDKEYYIEIHKLEYNKKLNKNVYKITNTYINEKGIEIEKSNILKTFTINSDIPLFSILKPAIVNPLDNKFHNVNGLGFSVYGTAIDQIKTCDITYNNFVMDFYLGGKKVFYNKNIVKRDSNNNPIYPDDITRQQWATYGDEMTNLKENPAITEYNPELRVEEDTKGMQFALNFLSFKAGLGTKYYEFNGSSIVTATQYVGDRQDLVKNANKHRKNVDEFVSNICKSILLIGRILLNQNVTEDCIVKMADKDGFLVDTETAKQEFRQDIAQGIRQAWEYRVKFLGEDEETAKSIVEGQKIEEIEEVEE